MFKCDCQLRRLASIGPQFFISSEAPGYNTAYIAMLCGYIIKLVAVIVLYLYMYRENKKRDREAAISGGDSAIETLAVERGMLDQTELDNPGFRYVL